MRLCLQAKPQRWAIQPNKTLLFLMVSLLPQLHTLMTCQIQKCHQTSSLPAIEVMVIMSHAGLKAQSVRVEEISSTAEIEV